MLRHLGLTCPLGRASNLIQHGVVTPNPIGNNPNERRMTAVSCSSDHAKGQHVRDIRLISRRYFSRWMKTHLNQIKALPANFKTPSCAMLCHHGISRDLRAALDNSAKIRGLCV
jgi:hypothetical protein